MLKKILIAGGGGLLLLTVLLGRDVCSYVQTSVSWAHDSVRRQVPVTFELERARQMVADLKPEVRQNMHLIAKEEIDVARLSEQIGRLEARQHRGRQALLRLKAELDSGQESVRCGDATYSAREVTKLVGTRFQRYKTDDQTLENLRQVLAARQRGLAAARQKLDGMLSAKQQLLAEIANLEARQKMNEVAQTTSQYSFDDSHLARTRQLLRDIETRIQVEERLVQTELEFDHQILLEEEGVDAQDVSREMAAYFGRDEAPVEAVAELAADAQR